MSNYVATRVVAVPVCPPVSPCRGASIVRPPAHNACIFGMETPLRRRSAGTQAPPLPSQYVQASCEPEAKRFFARSNAASAETQKTVLAVTLQTLKHKKQCSQ